MRRKTPFYGLVLAGGRSTRMGIDKSTLMFHKKNQTQHCFGLLSRFCEKVFVSNRQEQSQLAEHKHLPQIHDVFFDKGPLGGILSAMTCYPGTSWLALACDLPFVNQEVLATLLQNRNPAKMATVFWNASRHAPEPLCAIYESQSQAHLSKFFEVNCYALKKILVQLEVHFVPQSAEALFINVNDPQEFRRISTSLTQYVI